MGQQDEQTQNCSWELLSLSPMTKNSQIPREAFLSRAKEDAEAQERNESSSGPCRELKDNLTISNPTDELLLPQLAQISKVESFKGQDAAHTPWKLLWMKSGNIIYPLPGNGPRESLMPSAPVSELPPGGLSEHSSGQMEFNPGHHLEFIWFISCQVPFADSCSFCFSFFSLQMNHIKEVTVEAEFGESDPWSNWCREGNPEQPWTILC